MCKGNGMTYRKSHSFTVIALAASLAMAGGARAQDRDRPDRHDREQRYEDAARHDSHEWNEREEKAYRHYLEERHKKYHDFAKASKKEQAEYWKWRHEHSDEDRR